MHRPAARRARLLTGALTALAVAGGCTDDGPTTRGVVVVDIAATPCDRPLAAAGLGVVLGDGLVVTAGHVVEGPRRTVTVDGAPAEVLVVDARTDLAVLRAGVAGTASLVDQPTGAVRVATPAGPIAAEVVHTGTLVVHDTTDRARYEREVHVIRPAVPAGTSGAPLVDAGGRVTGVVVLANRADGTSYAVTSEEIRRLLGANRSAAGAVPRADLGPDAAVPCPG
jgi:hypothetical protein